MTKEVREYWHMPRSDDEKGTHHYKIFYLSDTPGN